MKTTECVCYEVLGFLVMPYMTWIRHAHSRNHFCDSAVSIQGCSPHDI
jgi:hypothetical protein